MADALVALVMLINFALLGGASIRVLIRWAALQGGLIALLPLAQGHAGWRALVLVVVTLLVKGLVVPALLARVFQRLEVRREVEPFISFIPSLLLGTAATAGAVLIAGRLPLAPQHAGNLAVAASLATVLCGLLLMMTRRKAITQAVGYLVFENGTGLFGLALVGGIPFLVEASLLLDLVAGVFVMVVVMGHLQRALPSLDTGQLSVLRG
jgi:hydrogenase-4 component E